MRIGVSIRRGSLAVLPVVLALLLGQPEELLAQAGKGGPVGGQGGQAKLQGNGLAAGLQAGGQAIKHGIGKTVSALAQRGIHGQQLAALIHQLKANQGMIGGLPGGMGGLPGGHGHPGKGKMPGSKGHGHP